MSFLFREGRFVFSDTERNCLSKLKGSLLSGYES